MRCGHPIQCYREHGEHGSSCAWCVEVLREHLAWREAEDRAGALMRERDEAQANYCFMVERAADQRLDGYRELGARAAAAEEALDKTRAVHALTSAQLSMVASELCGDPKMPHDDKADPRWTPALHEAWAARQKHREDAAQIAGLLAEKRDLESRLSLEQASKDSRLSDAEVARHGAESMRDLAVRVVDDMRVALQHCLAAMERHDFGDTDHNLVVAADRALDAIMEMQTCGLMEIGSKRASAEVRVRQIIKCVHAPVFANERDMICRTLRLPAPKTTDVEPLGLCDRCDEPVMPGQDKDIAGKMVCAACHENEQVEDEQGGER
jgi:hypothetical protein